MRNNSFVENNDVERVVFDWSYKKIGIFLALQLSFVSKCEKKIIIFWLESLELLNKILR